MPLASSVRFDRTSAVLFLWLLVNRLEFLRHRKSTARSSMKRTWNALRGVTLVKITHDGRILFFDFYPVRCGVVADPKF